MVESNSIEDSSFHVSNVYQNDQQQFRLNKISEIFLLQKLKKEN